MKGVYRTDPSTDAQVTAVDLEDGRHFLVARFKIREWKTLVFEHETSPDCWVSKRDIDGYFEPEAAVTGHLLQRTVFPDPVTRMKRELEVARRSYWTIHKELLKLKADASAKGRDRKRGVTRNGRRNT